MVIFHHLTAGPKGIEYVSAMAALIRHSSSSPRPPSALRQARLGADLSLTELADQAGLSRTTVHLLEHAKQTPSLVTAQRLASALGMTVDHLFPFDRRRG